jgi:hypothetical protein
MRPFLARFSEPVWSGHLASWADFITTTPEPQFSVYLVRRAHKKSSLAKNTRMFSKKRRATSGGRSSFLVNAAGPSCRCRPYTRAITAAAPWYCIAGKVRRLRRNRMRPPPPTPVSSRFRGFTSARRAPSDNPSSATSLALGLRTNSTRRCGLIELALPPICSARPIWMREVWVHHTLGCPTRR